jgi:hypothetical protein
MIRTLTVRLALVCLALSSAFAELPKYSYPVKMSPAAVQARLTDKYPLAGGFTLKVSTGEVFDEKGVKQPHTFVYTEVVNGIDGFVVPANPLQFASKATALAIKETLEVLFPSNRFVLTEHRKVGPYGNTSLEYGVKSDAPCTTVMNAGLLAHKVLMYPDFWAFLLTLEATPYLSGPQGCEE